MEPGGGYAERECCEYLKYLEYLEDLEYLEVNALDTWTT